MPIATATATPAPVGDPAQPLPPPPPPPEAPVTDPIAKKIASEAPVSDSPRMQIGSKLAEYLLAIVAGSILIFVLYLVALDGVTSNEVTQVYNQTFHQMDTIPISHDASGADDASQILRSASRSSNTETSAADARKLRDIIEQLKKSGRVTASNTTRLDVCVRLAEKPTIVGASSKMTTKGAFPTATPSRAAIAPPSPTATATVAPTASPSSVATDTPASIPTVTSSPNATDAVAPPATATVIPSPTTSVAPSPTETAAPAPTNEVRDQTAEQSDADERTKAFDECVQILGPLRLLSTSQAIDLDRLRLMKEFAQDAHDHRQAFRSFWLQAAQLVLLNLLLPLLTALLGYIFGSSQRS
jgi:hypothetical protein